MIGGAPDGFCGSDMSIGGFIFGVRDNHLFGCDRKQKTKVLTQRQFNSRRMEENFPQLQRGNEFYSQERDACLQETMPEELGARLVRQNNNCRLASGASNQRHRLKPRLEHIFPSALKRSTDMKRRLSPVFLPFGASLNHRLI